MTRKTGSQGRDNAKWSNGQKARFWATYMGQPCWMCGLAIYVGKDRTGRFPSDGVGAHLLPHEKGGLYNEENMFPCCTACNDATGTRDLRPMVGMRLPVLHAWVSGPVAAATFPTLYARFVPTLRGRVEPHGPEGKAERAQRDAARRARGWSF